MEAIFFSCRYDVYPVKGTELIKMNNMVMDAVGSNDKIPDELCIDRYFKIQCILNSPY